MMENLEEFKRKQKIVDGTNDSADGEVLNDRFDLTLFLIALVKLLQILWLLFGASFDH
jgi:hypothetical protein